MKVLLDTDIGSDIDDAVALAYLLAQPRCELMGITTVSGEPDKRAMLASAICRNVGRDAPIFPGIAEPLTVASRQPRAPQAEKLGAWEYRPQFPRGEAIDFLRHAIHQHARAITLLAIGPLTNIAVLFKADPDIPFLLDKLVLMGGRFAAPAPPRAEWNILNDPHAADIVFRAMQQPGACVAYGLDVTNQVVMDAAAVRARFGARVLRPVLDFAEVWFRQRPTLTFHDPLAAAAIFEPGLCGYEAGHVAVNLTAGEAEGETAFSASAAGPHTIANRVEPARFFDHFFNIVQTDRFE